MRVMRLGGSRVLVSDVSELLASKYKTEHPDYGKLVTEGKRLVSKANESKKIVHAPYSMLKLLNLLDVDEYHNGCVDAAATASVIKAECKNAKVRAWLDMAEYPACEAESTILTEFMRHYLACGNGFLIKMRNAAGEWIGLERLLPSEVQIIENYDGYGFWKPDYIQVKNNMRKDHAYGDIIHIRKATHRSNAWGLACLPVVINIEILNEIKTFDYNNFKNGLMADYFMIVEGGTLRDGVVSDENGNEVVSDAYKEIEQALSEVKGNKRSHSTVLIESESRDVKIRLEPLRQQDRDGGFLSLKKDLREGIFAYHRVPPRVVSQLVSGQLGGDNNSDMRLFYNFVVKPLQNRLALTLAYEFNYEFGWGVKASDWDFGVITDELMNDDEKLFRASRNW